MIGSHSAKSSFVPVLAEHSGDWLSQPLRHLLANYPSSVLLNEAHADIHLGDTAV
jgi:hypothetical protein